MKHISYFILQNMLSCNMLKSSSCFSKCSKINTFLFHKTVSGQHQTWVKYINDIMDIFILRVAIKFFHNIMYTLTLSIYWKILFLKYIKLIYKNRNAENILRIIKFIWKYMKQSIQFIQKISMKQCLEQKTETSSTTGANKYQ